MQGKRRTMLDCYSRMSIKSHFCLPGWISIFIKHQPSDTSDKKEERKVSV